MIRDLVARNRSYRRFDEDAVIDRKTLEALVDLARLSGTGGNMQPLKFMLSCEAEQNARIYPSLAWAGYLKDWDGPAPGERPTAYVIILCDKDVNASAGCDHGIAAQSILLGAVEKGLGGCMIGSINRTALRDTLQLEPRYEILLVLALGKPVETVHLDDVGADGHIEYWRDEDGVHHVPKRPLASLIL